jgi:tetratricopeptide (TPR) repeat protein
MIRADPDAVQLDTVRIDMFPLRAAFVALIALGWNAVRLEAQLPRSDSIEVWNERAWAAYQEGSDSSVRRAIHLWRGVHDAATDAKRTNAAGAALNAIGLGYQKLGMADSAVSHFYQALGLFRSVGHAFNQAIALYNLGRAFEDQALADSAMRCYREALDESARTEDGRLQERIRKRIETLEAASKRSPGFP